MQAAVPLFAPEAAEADWPLEPGLRVNRTETNKETA
jgi:hypothetical protein